jgi:tRNA (adenine22-N1)-methyltransferase
MDESRFSRLEDDNVRRAPALTPRLMKLAGMVREGAVLWDVGTDHGKLPVRLLLDGKLRHAVASDIKAGPLDSARETAKRFGVEGSIEYRLCDGLDGNVPDGIDTVVIAGMGGETIIDILENARWLAGSEVRLLLQPMSGIYKLRSYLYSNHYTVFGEHLVRERDKIYLCIDAAAGGSAESFSFLDTRIGKYTKAEEPYLDYIKKEMFRLKKELNGADAEYKGVIQKAIGEIESMIKGYPQIAEQQKQSDGSI